MPLVCWRMSFVCSVPESSSYFCSSQFCRRNIFWSVFSPPNDTIGTLYHCCYCQKILSWLIHLLTGQSPVDSQVLFLYLSARYFVWLLCFGNFSFFGKSFNTIITHYIFFFLKGTAYARKPASICFWQSLSSSDHGKWMKANLLVIQK